VISISVYLSVYLSVPYISQNQVMYCIVDDIMFSHNEANGPESKITCMFHRVCLFWVCMCR